MRNIYITFLFLIFCSMAYAQEQAKYRVTYDCDAQIVTGKTNTYRWTLDIGETTAVFYNNNYRLYSSELAKVKAQGGDRRTSRLPHSLPTPQPIGNISLNYMYSLLKDGC